MPGATITGVRELAWGSLGSPAGEISVGCTAAGVSRVGFGAPPAAGPAGGAAAQALLALALAQVDEYFAGRRQAFGLPIDWSGSSGGQRQVLPVLAGSVGYGQTVTYAELAARAGLVVTGQVPPARVAGQVLASNPCPILVPCHRVVAGNGLGGFSGGIGIELKRWLLIFEGALPPTLDWDPAGPLASLG